MSFNLRSVSDLDISSLIKDPQSDSGKEIASKLHLKVSNTPIVNGAKYSLFRYEKKGLTEDSFSTSGLFRSVIVSDGKVVGVSLPKSHRPDKFLEFKAKATEGENVVFTQMVEGTMVNLFYNSAKATGLGATQDDPEGLGWELSTRSVVGAKNSYFDNGSSGKKNFVDMFYEALPKGLKFDQKCGLNRKSCYSLVLQHPDNRMVQPITEPKLYLVAVFTRVDEDGFEWNIEEVKPVADSTVLHHFHLVPRVEFSSSLDVVSSMVGKDYKFMGIHMSLSSNPMIRSKVLNPQYVSVRELRGTQPKLQYHYLTLRSKKGALKAYLKHYPEHTEVFNKYRDQVHQFTKDLQSMYWACYVKHEKPLGEFPIKFRPHMFSLHQEFKVSKKPVLLHTVINYVNTLESPKLMYSLNWDMRQKAKDEAVLKQNNK
jgi:hypothetical protein